MLKGRFGDTSGCPFLEGYLHILSQSVSVEISFLVDTGADETMLMPTDGMRTTLDYNALTTSKDVYGINGVMSVYTEPALIVFAQPKKRLFVYSVNISIAPPNPDLMGVHSLLGRDILDRWEMVYRPTSDTLVFNVVSADITVPLA